MTDLTQVGIDFVAVLAGVILGFEFDRLHRQRSKKQREGGIA